MSEDQWKTSHNWDFLANFICANTLYTMFSAFDSEGKGWWGKRGKRRQHYKTKGSNSCDFGCPGKQWVSSTVNAADH